MKRILAIVLALVMLLSLAGCSFGKPEEEPTVPTMVPPTEPAQKVLHILLPDTMDAQAMGLADVQAQNTDVKIVTYADAQAQTALLNEIAAQSPKDGTHGVVTIPASREMADVFTALTDANVAYALADTIPTGAEAASVANVCYDQRLIGAAAAAYLVANGLTQDQKVVIIQGLSEEEAERTEGFKLYLQGKLEVDGKTIDEAWTSMASIIYSDMQGESQDSAEVYFDTYMESSDHADTKYIAAWNDAYVLGVMEALEGETIDAKIKQTFLEGKPFITGCGGAQTMVDVLAGNSQYSNLAAFGGIQTIACSQDLLKLAVEAMAAYLDGAVVQQDQTQPITWITPENASQY